MGLRLRAREDDSLRYANTVPRVKKVLGLMVSKEGDVDRRLE